MYTDRELTCSDGQVITATAVSTDSVAMTGLFSGRGGSTFRAYVQFDADFTAAGAATMNVEIIQADNGVLTSNVESLYATGATSLANLNATDGRRMFLDVPMPKNTKPFIGFRYTVATGPMTAGAVTAGFVPVTPTDLDDQPTYWTGWGA